MSQAPAAARVPGRRELVVCCLVASLLVLLRSYVFLRYERFFDSDQAIVGLMAKHLSEVRVFPLFYYGQHYMLGVEAWAAVPFFWLGGPTMAMLRTPLALANLAVAILFIVFLTHLGMRPVLAFAATLPFAITTTAVSKELYFLGGAVEPFLYIVGLWLLRRRPIAFGALLCFGYLHREFTIFALPAFALAMAGSWRTWSWSGIARGVAGFASVWLVVDQIKRHVSALGPADSPIGAGSLLLGPQTLGTGLSLNPLRYFPRLWEVLTIGLPDFFGGRGYAMVDYGITSTLRVGSMVAGLALAAAACVAGGRLLWLKMRRSAVQRADSRFFVYLAVIGVITLLMYSTNDNMDVHYAVQLRYLLFLLLLPIALFGAYFQAEPRVRWRWTVVALIAVWSAVNTRDNVRLVQEFRVAPIPAYHRRLADYLVAHGVKYAWAGYWDAYIVDFFARERVIVASTEKKRIDSYQRVVTAHDAESVQLVRQPCEGGRVFEAWCVEGDALAP